MAPGDEDRVRELSAEVQRLSLENLALLREQKRLLAQLAERPDAGEQRVTRAMVRGFRDDIRSIREQIELILDALSMRGNKDDSQA